MADVSGTSRSTASVDERIVEAKFDASDFEKGVNKTIKKLDELKSSLNLDDAGKSLTQVADETKKATEKASESVDQLEKRLTTFAGMLKQKFLGGLADQVVGVFFKMEHAVTGFVKEMTVGMADAGRAGYEQMLTSVRMITNAFKRDANGKIIGRYETDEAYSALEKLKTYADETSYSMDQMTDAMSKMVAAGVPLEDAAKNVQGIANACANAGINAQDASRAFFNLSQAYSSGVLKYTDYRSLELLNMTNESFKQAMLDAGVEAGTLKKTKDGVYKTVRKKGTKVTGGKTVNMQNLTDSLKYSWMTTEGMDKLFGKQFYADIDEITTMLYDKNMSMEEVLDVISEKYGETAANAFKAAREARSFTDVVNTLRGIASAGWSNIWENMFGKLEEATKFFTELADGGIADAIRSLFSYVNALLGAWADGGAESGGRDAFKETLLTIDELIGEINEKLMSLLPNSEDAGYAFKRFTQDTRDNVNKFKSWLTDVGEDGESRLDKLVNVARIFSQTFGVAFYALGKAFSLAEPVLSGAFVILDKLIEPLSQLGKNSKPFDDLTASVDNFYTVLSPITKLLGDVMGIVGEVAAFFFSGAIDTAIMNISFFSDAFGLLLEVITGDSAQKQQDGKGVIGHITDDIENLKNVCMAAIGAVKDFFASLFDDLRKILGLSTDVENGEAGEGFFSSVKNFFDTNQFLKDADAWIQQAKTDIDSWIAKLPEKITNFATRIQEAIFGLFYTKETQTKTVTDDVHTVTRTFEVIKETDLKKNLDAWWESIKSTVTDFITNLPGKVHELTSKLFDAVYGLFYTKESRTVSVTDDTHTTTKKFEFVKETDLKKGLDAWWEGVKKSVTEFIDSIPKRVQDFFNSIPDLWNMLMTSLFGSGSDQTEATSDAAATTDTTQAAEKTETELDKWLSTVKDTIIEFIKSIPTRLATLSTKIYETIFGIFYERKEVNVANTGKTTTLIATPFKKWIDGIRKSINQWLNKLPKITLQDLWNRIFVVEKKDDKGNVVQEKTGFALMLEGIFGEEQIQNFKASIDNFIEKISGFVENAKKIFNSIWTRISGELSAENFSDTIKGIFDDILNLIASLFTGTTDIEANGEWFANTVASAITWIKTKAEKAWPTVRDFIKSIPSKIAGLFKSGDSGDQEQSAVGKAISDFGATVGGFIADLPGMITGFFDSAVTEIDALWGRIYKALSGEGEKQETPGIGENPIDMLGRPEKTVSKWDTFIGNLGSSISAAIAKLPEWLAQGLELAVKGVNWVLGKITELLTPAAIAESVESGTDVGQAVADAVASDTDPEKTAEASGLATTLGRLGQALLDLITKTIPGFIVAGFTAVKDKASEWLAPLQESFNNLAEQIPEDATLAQKIGFVGSKIVEKIKELIPESIKEGFENVRDNVNGWWDSLDGIFDQWLVENNKESSPLKKKIAQIGKVIKKAIEDLGQMIANLFGGQDPKEGIKIDVQKSEPTLFDQITSFIDKLMTSVGEYAKNAFGLILPFIIDGWNGLIETVGKFFGTIGDLITGEKKPIDVLNEVFGEESGAKIMESLTNFGATIENFFTKTIPETFNNIKASIEEKGGLGGILDGFFGQNFFANLFPGANAEELEENAKKAGEQVNNTIDNAFEEYLDVYDKGEKKRIKLFFHKNGDIDYAKTIKENEDVMYLTMLHLQGLTDKIHKDFDNKSFAFDESAIENTGNWFENIVNAFTSGKLSDKLLTGGGIILAILALVKVLETIKELINTFNVTGNLAEKAGSKNSIEAVFKRILAVMALAMGFAVYASQLNDDQFTKAEKVMGRITDFLTVIAGIYGGTSIFTGITDIISSNDSAGKAIEGAKNGGGLLGGIVSAAAGILKTAGSAVAAVEGGEYISGGLSNIFDSLADAFSSIGIGLENALVLLQPTVETLVKMSNDLDTALTVVDKIKELLSKFDGIAGTSKKFESILKVAANGFLGDESGKEHFEVDPNNDFKGQSEQILLNLSTRVNFFYTMSLLLKNLADSLSAISKVDNPLAQIKNVKDVLMSEDFDEIISRLAVIAKTYLLDTNDIFYGNTTEGLAYGLTAISQSMNILVTSMSDVDYADTNKAYKAIDIIEKLCQFLIEQDVNRSALHKLLSGDDSISAFGRQIQKFAGSLTSFFRSIKGYEGLDQESISLTSQKIDIIVALTKGLAEATTNLGSADAIRNLTEFGTQIETLGTSIGSFMVALNNEIPDDVANERLAALSQILTGLGDFAVGIATLRNLMTSAEDIPTYIEQFVIGLATLLKSKEDFVAVGKEIAVPLLQGIQAAFDNPEESGITLSIKPILSMDEIQEQLEKDINVGGVTTEGLVVSIPDDLRSKVLSTPDYTQDLVNIRDAVTYVNDSVGVLNTRIGELETAISNMKLYLNGNELVGGIMPDIQQRIAEQEFLSDHGVVAMFD